ncbi:unnamed protein product [Ectocarpus sp. 12 AP-2014]
MIGYRSREGAAGVAADVAATSHLVGGFDDSGGAVQSLRRQLHLPAPVDSPLGPEEEDAARRRMYFWGCILLVASGVFFVTSLYAIVFSKLMPPMGHPLLDAVREDSHYCYLVPLTIYPSCAALYMSWVSLKFFRHN